MSLLSCFKTILRKCVRTFCRLYCYSYFCNACVTFHDSQRNFCQSRKNKLDLQILRIHLEMQGKFLASMLGMYFLHCLLTVFTNGPRPGATPAHCRRSSDDNFKAFDLFSPYFATSVLTWQGRDYCTGKRMCIWLCWPNP